MMAKPTYEISQIISRFKSSFTEKFHPLSEQLHVLDALEKCRTAALGGHVDACPSCGSIKISYNSCRNRHCPKCQGWKREQWIEARKEELLPVKYFHVVFTLPDVLNPMALKHQKVVYGTLFRAAWATIKQFALAEGVQAGMVAILHTWGSNLQYHPHLHCIVAAGGITSQGKWKSFANASNHSPFLFSVKGMSLMFRAKFTAMLGKQLPIDSLVRKQMFNRHWVVYSKHPFAHIPMVVEYIGRYSHRVAITNSRITNVTNQQVSFTCKDYKQEGKKKDLTLGGEEFLRRFCLHILPTGFVRIRHYGYLGACNREKLRMLQAEFNLPAVPKKREKKRWAEYHLEHFGVSHLLCKDCGKAEMTTIQTIIPIVRPPPPLILPNINFYR
jgi:hypothetical protein